MNLDALSLSFLREELQDALFGARVDKVYQVNKDAICIYTYNKGNKYYLLLDVSKPCILLLDSPPAHMDSPTAFCMLLRKHLEMSRLTDVTQYKLDRIINFQFDNLGFNNQIVSKTLCVELTGKNSNIILLDDDRILQAIRHVGVRENSFRQIQPNQTYVLPPQKDNRLDLRSIRPRQLSAFAADAEPSLRLDKFLQQALEGVGGVIVQEIISRSGLVPTTVLQNLQEPEWQKLESSTQELQAAINSRKNIFAYSKRGRFLAVTPFIMQSLSSQAEVSLQVRNSVNQAAQYLLSLTPEQTPDKVIFSKLLSNEVAKQEKKILALQADLSKAEDAQRYKIIADNLMSYLYSITPKSKVFECTDIYEGGRLQVELNPQLSAVENANQYYRGYNKAKRGLALIQEQIQSTQEYIQYLNSLELSLSSIAKDNELAEFKKELEAAGLIKLSKKGSKQQAKPSLPLEIKLNAQTTIYVGKNNQQNDYLTFKIGKANDIWLHVQKQAGSHVIIKTSNAQPQEQEIVLAASLAAYFSKSRNSSSVPVDYVLRKHVWKPAGAKPGFVLYEKQNTVYVTPDVQEIEALLKLNNS